MTQQTINIGASANDGTGDPLRSAMTKVNDNFTELYATKDPVSHPGYVSGLWYSLPLASFTNSAVTAGYVYFVPVVFAREVTLQALGTRVGTGATGTMRFGVYSNLNGRPNALLAQGSSEPSTASIVDISTAFTSNPTLPAGVYWLAYQFSAAPSVRAILGTDFSTSAQIGGASVAAALHSGNGLGVRMVQAYASGLPATASSLVIANPCPVGAFQIA